MPVRPVTPGKGRTLKPGVIVDPWNPLETRHRFEAFCYDPKSCAAYHPGPSRKVRGARG
jgi:hypothetical protein